MNERFVAVRTVTGSRIRVCSSKRMRDFSVSRGWQQTMNAIRWSNLRKKSRQSLSRLKETEARHTATPPSIMA